MWKLRAVFSVSHIPYSDCKQLLLSGGRIFWRVPDWSAMEGPSNRRKIRDVSKSERDKKTSETLYGNPWRWLGIKRLLYHNIRIIGRIALLYWVLTTWSDCVVCVALIFRQDTRVIVTTKLHQVEMPAFYLYRRVVSASMLGGDILHVIDTD